MAIAFKIYQSTRKGNTNGKWYARATHRETLDLNKLAAHMASHNSSVTRGQIVAILTDAVGCMRELCLQSKKVKLDNLGIFYPTIQSKGARDAKKFSVANNIVGVHLRFLPAGESSTQNYMKVARVKETAYINK